MKILYLHRTQGVGVEGVHISGIVDALKAKGHVVKLIGPKNRKETAEDKLIFTRQNLKAMFARYAPELIFELGEFGYEQYRRRQLLRSFGSFRPDLVYERYAFFGSSGNSLCRKYDIPHVLEINYTVDDDLVRKRSTAFKAAARRVERKIFVEAAALAAVSSQLRKRIVERGVNPNRVALTPNAVSEEFYRDAMSNEPRKLPQITDGRVIIGFVGGFYPWHGLDLLFQAAATVSAMGREIALLLVGQGPELPRIRDKLANCPFPNVIAGAQARESIISWIRAMDICVLPDSNDYGSPMKIFEYMACGKPVVAPELAPLTDVISPGKEGLLFLPRSSSSLAAALVQLVDDSALREKMGGEGREIVGRKHTWGKNLERIFVTAGMGF